MAVLRGCYDARDLNCLACVDGCTRSFAGIASRKRERASRAGPEHHVHAPECTQTLCDRGRVYDLQGHPVAELRQQGPHSCCWLALHSAQRQAMDGYGSAGGAIYLYIAAACTLSEMQLVVGALAGSAGVRGRPQAAAAAAAAARCCFCRLCRRSGCRRSLGRRLQQQGAHTCSLCICHRPLPCSSAH